MKRSLLIFAALMLLSSWVSANSSKAKDTYAALEHLELLILRHSARVGHVPSTAEGLAVVRHPDGNPVRSSLLKDAWYEPLVYRYPSAVADRIFDLYSKGPNQIDEQGRGDDVVAWEYRNYGSGSGFAMTAFLLVVLFDGPVLLAVMAVLHWRRRRP